jgi:Uma2 family endonuclease
MSLRTQLITHIVTDHYLDPAPEVPNEVVDFASFREWTRSEQFPEQGRYTFYQDQLRIDLTMEQLFSHNDVKNALTRVLSSDLGLAIGRYFSDGVRVNIPRAGLSVEPDALFIRYDTLRSQRVIQRPSARNIGTVELEGPPDLVVEVVSDSSVSKDTIDLLRLYADSQIPEYWLIDARRMPVCFSIYQLHDGAYRLVPPIVEGWRSSAIFAHDFRLSITTDPLGLLVCRLEYRLTSESKS